MSIWEELNKMQQEFFMQTALQTHASNLEMKKMMAIAEIEKAKNIKDREHEKSLNMLSTYAQIYSQKREDLRRARLMLDDKAQSNEISQLAFESLDQSNLPVTTGGSQTASVLVQSMYDDDTAKLNAEIEATDVEIEKIEGTMKALNDRINYVTKAKSDIENIALYANMQGADQFYDPQEMEGLPMTMPIVEDPLGYSIGPMTVAQMDTAISKGAGLSSNEIETYDLTGDGLVDAKDSMLLQALGGATSRMGQIEGGEALYGKVLNKMSQLDNLASINKALQTRQKATGSDPIYYKSLKDDMNKEAEDRWQKSLKPYLTTYDPDTDTTVINPVFEGRLKEIMETQTGPGGEPNPLYVASEEQRLINIDAMKSAIVEIGKAFDVDQAIERIKSFQMTDPDLYAILRDGFGADFSTPLAEIMKSIAQRDMYHNEYVRSAGLIGLQPTTGSQKPVGPGRGSAIQTLIGKHGN